MTDTTPLSLAAVDQLCESRFAQLVLARQEFRVWALCSAYAHLHAAFPRAQRLCVDLSDRPENPCWIDSITTLDAVQVYRCGDAGPDAQQTAIAAAEDHLNDALAATPHRLPPGWQDIEDRPGLVDIVLTDVVVPGLNERDRYLAAVADALACGTDSADRLARYLTTTCPECGTQPAPGYDQHVLSCGEHVLIGCEGYFVVNPNLVGLNRPLWDDWTVPMATTEPLPTFDHAGSLTALGTAIDLGSDMNDGEA
jgi:hypothetical protein